MALTTDILFKWKGDASGAKASADTVGGAIGGVSTKVDRVGGKMQTVGKKMAGLSVAIVGVFTLGAKSLAENEVLLAQTESVLKSMGSAANVTSDDVFDLANSISGMSGVAHENIVEGENMLLTFGNIRNELGEGNDIFDQTTSLMVDMSVAMGTDVSAGAIQLGKALNDPITGVSALSKVGITFTDDQKDMIKAMVESGDVMGAQKIILKELENQFGGSAAAMGETMTGKINIMKNSFEEMARTLATAVMPMIEKFVGFLQSALNAFNNLSPGQKKMIQLLLGIVAVIAPLLIIGGKMVQSFKLISGAFKAMNLVFLTNPFVLLAIAIVALVVLVVLNWDKIVAFMKAAWDKIKELATVAWDFIKRIFQVSLDFIVNLSKTVWDFIKNVFKTSLDFIVNLSRTVWDFIKNVFSTSFDWIKNVVTVSWDFIKNVFQSALDLIVNTVNVAWNTITQAFATAWGIIKSAFSAALDFIVNLFLKWTLPGLIISHWDDIKAVFAAAWDAIKSAFSAALGFITGIVTRALDGWKRIISGAWNIIKATFTGAWNIIKTTVSGAVGFIRGVINTAFGAISVIVNNTVNFIKRIWENVWNGIKTKVSGVISWFSNIGGKFFTIGSNIIGGIIRGLGAIATRIFNALKAGIQTAINRVKSFFGFSSPSKVFALEVGVPIMQGIAMGVEGEEVKTASAIQRSFGRVADGLSLGGPLGLGAAAGGGGGITINVTVLGNAVTVRDLANDILDQIQLINRHRA